MVVLLARLLACSDFCLDRCEPEPVTKASSSAEDKVLNKVKKKSHRRRCQGQKLPDKTMT